MAEKSDNKQNKNFCLSHLVEAVVVYLEPIHSDRIKAKMHLAPELYACLKVTFR